MMDYNDIVVAKKKITTEREADLSTLEQIAQQKGYYKGMGTNGENGFGLYIDFFYIDSRDPPFENHLREKVKEILGTSYEGIPIYVRFGNMPEASDR